MSPLIGGVVIPENIYTGTTKTGSSYLYICCIYMSVCVLTHIIIINNENEAANLRVETKRGTGGRMPGGK